MYCTVHVHVKCTITEPLKNIIIMDRRKLVQVNMSDYTETTSCNATTM